MLVGCLLGLGEYSSAGGIGKVTYVRGGWCLFVLWAAWVIIPRAGGQVGDLTRSWGASQVTLPGAHELLGDYSTAWGGRVR